MRARRSFQPFHNLRTLAWISAPAAQASSLTTRPSAILQRAAPSIPVVNQLATFTLTASDSDGTSDIASVKYAINGGTQQTATTTTTSATAISSSPTYTPAVVGSTSVVFTVTDASGATCTKTLSYTVNAAPTCGTLTVCTWHPRAYLQGQQHFLACSVLFAGCTV